MRNTLFVLLLVGLCFGTCTAVSERPHVVKRRTVPAERPKRVGQAKVVWLDQASTRVLQANNTRSETAEAVKQRFRKRGYDVLVVSTSLFYDYKNRRPVGRNRLKGRLTTKQHPYSRPKGVLPKQGGFTILAAGVHSASEHDFVELGCGIKPYNPAGFPRSWRQRRTQRVMLGLKGGCVVIVEHSGATVSDMRYLATKLKLECAVLSDGGSSTAQSPYHLVFVRKKPSARRMASLFEYRLLE